MAKIQLTPLMLRISVSRVTVKRQVGWLVGWLGFTVPPTADNNYRLYLSTVIASKIHDSLMRFCECGNKWVIIRCEGIVQFGNFHFN